MTHNHRAGKLTGEDMDDVFFCDGCGKEFPDNERADLGEPYCVLCWAALPHDDDEEHQP